MSPTIAPVVLPTSVPIFSPSLLPTSSPTDAPDEGSEYEENSEGDAAGLSLEMLIGFTACNFSLLVLIAGLFLKMRSQVSSPCSVMQCSPINYVLCLDLSF